MEEALELLIHRCATDKELYSVVFFPHYCTREFSEFHLHLFQTFKFGQRRVRQVDGAPRGSAKSTFRSLIDPIHDVCYGTEGFIVVLSNTGPLAAAKLKDIRAEILQNSDLQAVYGVRFPTKNPGETQFVIESNAGSCAFMAFGKGAQLRGVRYKERRPTKIILDDVEHSDEVNSERQREKAEAWFNEDVSKLGDTDTNIIFLGTVLHKQSLLAKTVNNPAYESKVFKAIVSWSERQDLWDEWTKIYTNLDVPKAQRQADAQAFYDANETEMLRGTKVLWPEKESYLDLMKEMVEIGRRAFMKEKQNAPLGADQPLIEKIHWYKEVHDAKLGRCFLVESTGALIPFTHLQRHAYGVIDPSTGQTKAKDGKLGDFACLLAGFKYTANDATRLFIHFDWTKRQAPTKQIDAIFDMHEEFHFQKFGVETNLFRNLLLPNIQAEEKRRRAKDPKFERISWYDIEQVENKTERIFTIEPRLTHGNILLHRGLSETFRQQLEDFPHVDHDDGPDAVEMLWSLVNNRYKAAAISMDPMGGR
jgi:predicted phage terminase large subunit-like protein